jgi:hypothetical protein
MRPRIVLAIDNVHMGLGHDGLAALAKKYKADVTKLEAGELILFLNRQKDKFKFFGANHVLGYYRNPKGHRIALQALQYVPHAFAATGSLDMEKAMEEGLKQVLVSKLKQHPSPLQVARAMDGAGLTARKTS